LPIRAAIVALAASSSDEFEGDTRMTAKGWIAISSPKNVCSKKTTEPLALKYAIAPASERSASFTLPNPLRTDAGISHSRYGFPFYRGVRNAVAPTNIETRF